MTIANLDEVCPHDGKAIGDHTMREWSAHLEMGPHTDVAFENVPGGPVMMDIGDDEQLPVADTIIARAQVVEGMSGLARVRIPMLFLELQVGQPGGAPATFYKVGIIGPPDMLRKIGRLLRDTANGAANAAELLK